MIFKISPRYKVHTNNFRIYSPLISFSIGIGIFASRCVFTHPCKCDEVISWDTTEILSPVWLPRHHYFSAATFISPTVLPHCFFIITPTPFHRWFSSTKFHLWASFSRKRGFLWTFLHSTTSNQFSFNIPTNLANLCPLWKILKLL